MTSIDRVNASNAQRWADELNAVTKALFDAEMTLNQIAHEMRQYEDDDHALNIDNLAGAAAVAYRVAWDRCVEWQQYATARARHLNDTETRP